MSAATNAGVKLLELSVRAEREVISTWFYDAKFRAAWVPEPALFRVLAHRCMAELMAARGPSLDADQLEFELRRHPKAAELPANVVDDVVHGTPTVLDPWRSLAKLREVVALRELRMRLHEALKAVEENCDLSEARTLVSNALQAADVGSGAKAVTIRDAFSTTLLKASRRELREPGVQTGVRTLDSVTGGLRRGKVWVIAAESNWGKTAVAVWLADQAALAGIRPLIVRCEDPEELYAQRWIARRSRVEAWRLRDSELIGEDMRRATLTVQQAEDWPCFLDGIGKPAEVIAADIRSLCATHQIGLVMVDYIQCIGSLAKHENQRIKTAHIARTLTDAIKQAGVAGCLFSQVTKDKDGNVHVRDAEEIRNASEVLLYGRSETDKQLDQTGKVVGELEKKFLFVDKVKDGPKGFRIELDWQPRYASFQIEPDLPRNEPLPFEQQPPYPYADDD